VVQRLQMVISSVDSSSSSSSGGPAGASSLSLVDQSPLEKLLLGVLSHLTASSLCLEGMLEGADESGFPGGVQGGSIVQEMMELFLALPSLLPRTAGQLVQVMVPLLRRSSGLADRCALSLRKASFSKDVGSRLSAVSALMTLLHVQLMPPGRVNDQHQQGWTNTGGSGASSSSQSSVVNVPQPGGGGGNPIPGVLSIEEVLSLCRRFLHHQAPVRSQFVLLLNIILPVLNFI
jgi:hypothetical protein